MGYCRLRCGALGGVSESIEFTVPWRVVRSSPTAQVHHLMDCLLSAGFELEEHDGGIAIFAHGPTTLPVLGFEIGANLAGLDFPWHWIIDLWSGGERPRRDAPIMISTTTVVLGSSPASHEGVLDSATTGEIGLVSEAGDEVDARGALSADRTNTADAMDVDQQVGGFVIPPAVELDEH